MRRGPVEHEYQEQQEGKLYKTSALVEFRTV